MRSGDQIEPIRFPDVDPSDVPPNANFSMAAGDFLEVYQEPGKSGDLTEPIRSPLGMSDDHIELIRFLNVDLSYILLNDSF